MSEFIFLDSRITADGDCSHEIKRRLLLGRKVMTNLDSILKSRGITLSTKVWLVRLWFFQWSCMDARVGQWRKLSTKELMVLNCGVGEDSWESLGLQGDPTSPSWRRSVLGVHWKNWCWSWNSQYVGHLMRRVDSLEKTLMLGRIGGRRRRGRQRMRWLDGINWLDGHGFGWTPEVGDGQGGLACCGSWGSKELDTTEWLNWTDTYMLTYII